MTAFLLLCLILCESPFVPLNNWKQRTCLFYFFTWSAIPTSFVLKINCFGNATREDERGERRVERGCEIQGRGRFVPTMATVGMLNTSGSLSGNYL